MSSPGGPRFLLYSHDGMGLGHVRRNLNLAAAVMRQRADAVVLLATSASGLSALDIPAGVDVLRLPGLRKVDNDHYLPRRLAVTAGDVHQLRSALLATAVEHYEPDVVLADKHPVGVQGELEAALRLQRTAGRSAAVGLRDVLDAPERARRDLRRTGLVRHVRALHDRVLIYGQRELLDPLQGCDVPAWLRDRTTYCGYVAPTAPAVGPRPAPRAGRRPVVLAVTGGGEDGAPLLHAFLDAANGAGWDATAVAGPLASPSDEAALARRADAVGVRLVRSMPDLGRRLAEADAVVCMGGYNTIVEVLAGAVPAVCVPRVTPRVEQLVRARSLTGRDLLRTVEPHAADGTRLRREVIAALHVDRRALARRVHDAIDLDGASRAAHELLDLADTSRGATVAADAHLQGAAS